MTKLKAFLNRAKRRFLDLYEERPRVIQIGAVLLVLLSIYAVSRSSDVVRKVVRVEHEGEFKGKSILGEASSSVYEAKERTLAKTANEILNGQKKMTDDLEKMQARLALLEGQPNRGEGQDESAVNPATGDEVKADEVNLYSRPSVPTPPYEGRSSRSYRSYDNDGDAPYVGLMPTERTPPRGPDIVAFPVASEEPKEELGVVLPVGSYVRAKIIAGTDATTAEPDPVLLQLDYSHVLPNQRKIDLSGCFMTAKAQADLATERVKMKTMKLSCISKRGIAFEREVNGYVADNTDNKFAVSGSVNSKQDRVAAMAFLASVVEGVGKAVQQTQTTEQTTPLGGGQAVMTGDERKYLAGGAAANAAGAVSQWYLKQAENLLPSISVGSGRDVWIIILDNVNLPKDHFMKGAGNEARYSYVTRILD